MDYVPTDEDYAVLGKAALEYANSRAKGLDTPLSEILDRVTVNNSERRAFVEEVLGQTVVPLMEANADFRSHEVNRRRSSRIDNPPPR